MPNLLNAPSFPKKIVTYGSHPGNKKKIIYKYVPDDRYGCPRRYPNGFEDIDEAIQTWASDIDFKSLGKALVGQCSDVRKHFFSEEPISDASQLPQNVHELAAMHNKLVSEFEKLPEDLRALFGNDYQTFIKAGRDGTIGKTFEDYFTGNKPADAVTEQNSEGGDK